MLIPAMDASRPHLTRGVKCSGAPKRLCRFGHDGSDLDKFILPLLIQLKLEFQHWKQLMYDIPIIRTVRMVISAMETRI